MGVRLWTIVILFISTLSVWFASWAAENDKLLHLYVLDVGQGDAIFFESPSGKQVIIDGGRDRRVLSELEKLMDRGDQSIDMVISTHPDADHIGGLSHVLERYEVDMVVMSGAAVETDVFKKFTSLVEGEGAERIFVSAGDRIIVDEQLYFDVYYPRPDAHDDSTNAQSIVFRSVFKEGTALLTGDIGRANEIEILQSNVQLESDVLKVAHHGSQYSSIDHFLSLVSAPYAVISSGENSYGHPHADTLARLRHSGAEVFRTDEEGTLHFVSDGNHFSVVRKK